MFSAFDPGLAVMGRRFSFAAMTLDFSVLAPRDAYNWMINAITPRPIAWVSTISAAGQTNLAPFSFFQGACANPPTLLFIGANDRTGKKKDSVINVEQVPEFVVNIVPFALRETMNQTAAPLPHGESEFEKFQIATAPSLKVRPPRVADAPVAFECKLDRIVNIGAGPLASNVVFGTILCAHVSESVLGADGTIDQHKLDTIGRMGGDYYTRTTEVFTIARPR
jgi:flavin reductase (DIM6/NTAB) family NADH-FMN oxidoreductase RutF